MSELDKVMIFRADRTICAGQCDGCDAQDRCACGHTRVYCQAITEHEARHCCQACSHGLH
jgi:hypothetical protein